MLNFKKSKLGFTLIELMVVVAIIGVLALLGLRLYTNQQEKAKMALVKANAGTVQVQIQTALVDDTIGDVETDVGAAAATSALISSANIFNPYTGDQQTINGTDGASGTEHAGEVYVTTTTGTGVFLVNGNDVNGDPVYAGDGLIAQK